jgi:predicted RNA-binding Zn ribbon-like protein
MDSMVTRSEPGYRWDFCGGHLAIDFTNTVGGRGGARQEHFNRWADVVGWAEARGVVSRARAAALRRAAARRPAAARAALASALGLREAIYDVLAAVSGGRVPPAAALARLNRAVAATFSRARLAPRGRHLRLTTAADGHEEASILDPVVHAAVELVTSAAIAHVRTCADPDCAWLFLDATRNGARRWCDMKVCGNRAKVRRFRARA